MMATFLLLQWKNSDDQYPSHVSEFHGELPEAEKEAKKLHMKGKALTTTTLIEVSRGEALVRFSKGAK